MAQAALLFSTFLIFFLKFFFLSLFFSAVFFRSFFLKPFPSVSRAAADRRRPGLRQRGGVCAAAGRLATPALLPRVARCAALLFCPSADPTWDDAGAAIRVARRPCASE